MIYEEKIFKYRVILFSFFVILSEILNEVGGILFPAHKWIIQLLRFICSCGIILFLFLLLKGINKTTKELRNSNEKLKNIFDTLDVAIWFHDLKSNTLLITPGIEKLYGCSLKEFYRDHELWKKVIYPEDLYLLDERDQKIEMGEPVTSIYRITRPDGEVRWIQDRGIPTFDEKGNLEEFTSVLFDITDRKESEDRYRSLVELSPDIIAVISNDKIDFINETGSKLVGALSPFELINQPTSKFINSPSLTNIHKLIQTADDNEIEEKIQFEIQVKRIDGKTIDVEMSSMPILYEGRNARQLVGRDITERKKVEKTIENLAYYDTLTGLPNRNKFRHHLNTVLSKANCGFLAVLFLDLDRFKMINDTKGHTTGDILLKKVTNYLQKAVNNEGMVSRQGGDEFIILLENINRFKTAQIAQKIIKEFSNPIKLENGEFFVTTSIGISMYPEDGEDQETLIKHADSAMYLAKELGRNKYQFYTSQLNDLAARKMELENGIRKALNQDELILFYQPKVQLRTGRIVGVEALIRWKHPVLGMIPPSEFIPLAEETGLILPLGNWILRKACEQHKAWESVGLGTILIAVNISVRQLQDDEFIDNVKQVLKQVGMDSKYLELEITESIMQNIEKSIIILNQLKQLGLKIAIDDFGKGYSSLSYLKHLPIDEIKIDKLFVDDIHDQSKQGSIVKAIIDMGHSLNFTLIAEGIEKREQAKFLRVNECELGQGYYFCKPLPAEEITILLRDAVVYDIN